MVRALWILVITTTAWAVCMSIEAGEFDKSRSTDLITWFSSPVAMLELAYSSEGFASVLDQGDRQKNIKVMRVNTYMDCLFIILYCSTLILLGLVCSNQPVLRTTLSLSVLATGIFDYWENVRLLGTLRIMQSMSPGQAALPRPVSLAKWAFLALGLMFVAVAMWKAMSKVASRLLIPMAIFVSFASACTVVGLFWNDLISFSVLGLFPALLCAAWIWKPRCKPFMADP